MSYGSQNQQTRDELRSATPSIRPVVKSNNENVKPIDSGLIVKGFAVSKASIVGINPFNVVGGTDTVVGKQGVESVVLVEQRDNLFYEGFNFTDYIDLDNSTGTYTGDE